MMGDDQARHMFTRRNNTHATSARHAETTHILRAYSLETRRPHARIATDTPSSNNPGADLELSGETIESNWDTVTDR